MADILVIDDDTGSREVIVEALDREGHRVAAERSGASGAARLAADEFDLVITDLVMPGVDGLEILAAARAKSPAPEVIILTGFGSVETAVEAMKNGAYSYLNKPINIKELREVARKALEKQTLARDNESLRRTVDEKYGFEAIVGSSEPMAALFAHIRQIAPTSATVLITGPSGTGKELIAQAIHRNSPRRARPFFAFNCGALTDSLIESELFGHEKGAFTGAVSDRKGYFELADGGTLLLDEIGEMPAHTQVKLLRVLETRSFFRVGGSLSRNVDVRVLAATNRDLSQMIKAGTFREDLYYRLKVVTLDVPPLAARRGDIPLLAAAFLAEFTQRHGRRIQPLPPEVLDRLQAYDWPGNVRELRNLVENLVVTVPGDVIDLPSLPEALRGATGVGAASGPVSFPDGMTMDEIERAVIRIALERTGGNKKRAAERLGMSLRTFHRKVKEMER